MTEQPDLPSRPPAAGLLIAGTSSDAGKSLLVTALCRAYARRGVRVAPFKAQNMSNNSMVCTDGSEIGRAQYAQARAAGVEPSSLHNPVLLKPGSDRTAHVVVRGQPAGILRAGEYATGRRHLAQAAFAAYGELAQQSDLIICEGAGSPAEINLRTGDYVNLGLAREFGLPVVVVGDIDRGGILAALYGTWALLDDGDRSLLRGFVINKFRGDRSVLEPGLTEITRRTGIPFLGVLPWLEQVWIDSEDNLAPPSSMIRSASMISSATMIRSPTMIDSTGGDTLQVAVVRLPRISNATDVDALAAEPGVSVTVTTTPATVRSADLVVLPGTRATVSDLGWLRERGLAEALTQRAHHGGAILGICGGYQMLAELITDGVESDGGPVEGLGLLPVRVDFGAAKVLGRPTGTWGDTAVGGYEIHHGLASRTTDRGEAFLDGVRLGSVWGTMWHGTLEGDAFRRAWLVEIARQAGSGWTPDPTAPGFADRRTAMVELLADTVTEHLDLDALLALTSTPLP